MFENNSFTEKTIVSRLKEISKSKYGLISINYILINCRMEDLLTFIRNYGISLPDKPFITRFEYIIIIALHLTKMYYNTDIQNLAMISHSSEEIPMDKELVSGFLSAMDSFVSEIGGTTSMNEINYKGFYIHAVYGEYVKLALFLSRPASQSLKERLAYFLNHFEEHYHDQILNFKEIGNTAIFDKERIIELIKEILSV